MYFHQWSDVTRRAKVLFFFSLSRATKVRPSLSCLVSQRGSANCNLSPPPFFFPRFPYLSSLSTLLAFQRSKPPFSVRHTCRRYVSLSRSSVWRDTRGQCAFTMGNKNGADKDRCFSKLFFSRGFVLYSYILTVGSRGVSFHIPSGINSIWSRMKRRSRLTLKRFGEYSANTEGCSGSYFRNVAK